MIASYGYGLLFISIIRRMRFHQAPGTVVDMKLIHLATGILADKWFYDHDHQEIRRRMKFQLQNAN